MNNQGKMIQESKKEAQQNLNRYFESKKKIKKIQQGKVDFIINTETRLIHENFQEGYQQGFREAITITVDLMFDKCYQDIEKEHFKLIEKILEDN